MPEKWPPLLGRSAAASEVADLVLYLASDESRYVTGTEVVIDAGFTLLRGWATETPTDLPAARGYRRRPHTGFEVTLGTVPSMKAASFPCWAIGWERQA